MITIPSLSDVTDILDTDLVMVTNAQGQSYKIAGSELNKRNKIIIASSTTVTGTPLKTGNVVRIYFTADITAANATTTMQIKYNNVNYYVKVPKNGALVNFVANVVGNTYKYVQAYTTLELLYDGTQFVIVGNPIVISSADYTIYADGLKVLPESNVDSVIYDSSITDCNDAWQTGKNLTYNIPNTSQNVPSTKNGWYIESITNPVTWSSNKYVIQIATPSTNINSNEMYIRHAYLLNNEMVWTPWVKTLDTNVISGITYNEYVDDFTLTYLSASTFLNKYFSNLFTTGVFYSVEMTAIDKVTGKYIQVLYNCKKDTTASYKIIEQNGLGVSGSNQYGTILISGLTSGQNLIQKTKILAIVQNGTYVAL